MDHVRVGGYNVHIVLQSMEEREHDVAYKKFKKIIIINIK